MKPLLNQPKTKIMNTRTKLFIISTLFLFHVSIAQQKSSQAKNTSVTKTNKTKIEACDLLTPELIKEIMQVDVTKDKEALVDFEVKKGTEVSACSYTIKKSKESGFYLSVTKYTSPQTLKKEWDKMIAGITKNEKKAPKNIDGLGDKAIDNCYQGYCHLEILKGDLWLSIDGTIEGKDAKKLREQTILLATKIIEKL